MLTHPRGVIPLARLPAAHNLLAWRKARWTLPRVGWRTSRRRGKCRFLLRWLRHRWYVGPRSTRSFVHVIRHRPLTVPRRSQDDVTLIYYLPPSLHVPAHATSPTGSYPVFWSPPYYVRTGPRSWGSSWSPLSNHSCMSLVTGGTYFIGPQSKWI